MQKTTGPKMLTCKMKSYGFEKCMVYIINSEYLPTPNKHLKVIDNIAICFQSCSYHVLEIKYKLELRRVNEHTGTGRHLTVLLGV